VGSALAAREAYDIPTWGNGSTAPANVRTKEIFLESEVSKIIGAMPFLWLAVEDAPGKSSLRGYIERNTIALLSNYQRTPLDSASQTWLGSYCNRDRVRGSGLWNSNHVDEAYDPNFLDMLSQLVSRVEAIK
jgi:hypothetical protein